MKKKLIPFLQLIVLVAVCIPMNVLAHPGKTDGSGGHRDRSTGEYHYHHGYPAHEHYDVDGDGAIDCPYDFDDQTRHNTGSSSSVDSKSNYSSIYTPPTISVESSQPTESTATAEKEVKIVPIWCFMPLIFIIICQWVSIRQKKDDIDYWRQKNKQDKETLISEYEAKLQNQKNDYDAKISAKLELDTLRKEIASARLLVIKEYKELKKTKTERSQIKNAPLDVYFAEDGLPVYWKPNINKPYGDYTVFLSPRSQIYHTNPYCSSYSSKPRHIFDVIDQTRPCKKCAEGFFDFITVPDWYRTDNNQLSIFDD